MGGDRMEQMNAREIQAALAQPFAPEDLEWRLQQVNEEKPWGIAVPYVTNRAIQNRLDDVVGPDNWYNDYKPWHSAGKKEAQICGISIYFEGRGFITKWDGAEDSDIEPIKGGLSDSMKRAAVQWGIGRVLYNMDAVFVDVEKRGKTWYIAKKDQAKLDRAYLDMLRSLSLIPAKAGGTQSQLAPRGASETSPVPRQSTGAPSSSAGQGEPEKRGQPPAGTQPPQKSGPPEASQPAYEYRVLEAKVQGGMKSSSTMVVLEALDGKRIQAFVRGVRPELTAGAYLTAVKLTLKRQDTVAYYILEHYDLAAPPQAA